MGAMIDFLYYGEANIYQENLDSFLAVAEELQLKGLIGSGAKEEVEELNNPPTLKKKAKHLKQEQMHKRQDHTTSDSIFIGEKESSPPQDGTVAVTDYTVAADLQDLDDKIKSMMMLSENHAGENRGRARICKVCGKEGMMGDIKKHIEANHITRVSHNCNICGKTSRSRAALSMHKSTYHRK